MTRFLVIAAVLFLPSIAFAQAEPVVLKLAGDAAGGQSYSLSMQILIIMTLLTVLPAVLLSTSAFVRIIIVLSILRQALGTAQTPPNQVLLGVALLLTFFVMSPVINEIRANAAEPYAAGELTMQQALEVGLQPLKTFMINQTRESDFNLFVDISRRTDIESVEDAPMSIIIPSFIVSELKTAFQIGFLIFIPFLVIDLVVSSVLMSMGMMMLSPMLISLPFKIMLFVLVDGWALIMGTLAGSFFV